MFGWDEILTSFSNALSLFDGYDKSGYPACRWPVSPRG
jgi:hypothetical protein